MMRKKRLCFDRLCIVLYSPRKKTIAQATSKIMMVRMAVARLELTLVTPIFANIAVSDANKAESSAYTHHINFSFIVNGKWFIDFSLTIHRKPFTKISIDQLPRNFKQTGFGILISFPVAFNIPVTGSMEKTTILFVSRLATSKK